MCPLQYKIGLINKLVVGKVLSDHGAPTQLVLDPFIHKTTQTLDTHGMKEGLALRVIKTLHEVTMSRTVL